MSAARLAYLVALAATRVRLGALRLDADVVDWHDGLTHVDVTDPDAEPLALVYGHARSGLLTLLPASVPTDYAEQWAFDHGLVAPVGAEWDAETYAVYCDALNRAWLAEVAARRVPLAAQRPAALVGVA